MSRGPAILAEIPSGSSSQPGTDDPGTPGSSSSSTTDPTGNNSEGGVAINPETGRPYGY